MFSWHQPKFLSQECVALSLNVAVEPERFEHGPPEATALESRTSSGFWRCGAAVVLAAAAAVGTLGFAPAGAAQQPPQSVDAGATGATQDDVGTSTTSRQAGAGVLLPGPPADAAGKPFC